MGSEAGTNDARDGLIGEKVCGDGAAERREVR